MLKNKILFLVLVISLYLISPVQIFAANYKFPWSNGVDWQYLQGWHCNSYNCAIDVGIGSGDNYKNALAASDGTVTHICADGTSYYINIDNSDGTMGYFHILNGTLEPSIFNQASIEQGQYIGKLKTGSWSPDPGCGYANQTTSTGHIHWTFNTNINYLIDGWSLKYPTNTFKNIDNVQKNVLDLLDSTNTMLLRNAVISSNKTYENNGDIILSSNGADLYLTPSSANIISIISH